MVRMRGNVSESAEVAGDGLPSSGHMLYDKPGHLIRRAQQIANAIFSEECGRFDVTTVQYAVLLILDERPSADLVTLAGRVGTDRSTMGAVAVRLVDRGLVTSAPGQTDRRTKVLSITEAGRVLVREMTAAVARVQERILAPLPEEQRPQFLAMLKLMVETNNELSRAPLGPVEK